MNSKNNFLMRSPHLASLISFLLLALGFCFYCTVFNQPDLIYAFDFSPPVQASAVSEGRSLEGKKFDPERISVRQAKNANGHTSILARVLIKAPLSAVWNAVHEERHHDPDLAYSKLISQNSNKNECTLEQKFVLLPIVGSAVCLMANSEVPFERIDYKLLKSDHFKAMEGSWVLTPCQSGKCTVLELSSYVDMGLPIPQSLMNGAASHKLKVRLARVKSMAEQLSPTVPPSAETPSINSSMRIVPLIP